MLLPPSEGKSSPVRGKPLTLGEMSFPALTAAREEVVAALVRLCEEDCEQAAHTLGLGPTQVAEVRRNRHLRTAPTARADAIYTGVLYDALDLGSLDAPARRRAARSLAITSSVFGLIRPGDRIPSYRLAGEVNLPGVGVVSTHWRAVLDPVVREAAGNGLVVDLRSTTYAAFWRPPPHLVEFVNVRVLRQSGTKRKVVSHSNKATKGRLVRSLLEGGATAASPTRLADAMSGLGWKVELDPSRKQLDVIVDEL